MHFNELKDKNVLILTLTRFISCLGDGIFFVTVNWLVYQASKSTMKVALFQAIPSIVALIIIPFIGVLTDKYSRKTLVMVSDILRAIAILIIIILRIYNIFVLRDIYIFNIVLIICESVYFIAYSGLIVDSIKRENIVNFNVLTTVAYQSGYILGCFIGGIIINKIGVTGGLAIDMLTFIISSILIFLVRTIYKVESDNSKDTKKDVNYIKSMIDAIRVLNNDKLILYLVIFSIPALIFTRIFNMLEPIFVGNILSGNSASFGIIDSAMGVGSILGALIIKFLNEIKLEHIYLWIGYLLLGISCILFTFVTNIWGAVILSFIIGVIYSGIGIIYTGEIQSNVNRGYMGRISSVRRFLKNIISSLSVMVLGWIGLAVKVNYLFLFVGICLIIVSVYGYKCLRNRLISKKLEVN